MSGKKSRNKGANGEREFFRLVHEELGIKLKRNLSQYQESGEGDAQLADFHIEVKRGKRYESRWWAQACEETPMGMSTALCYRLDRAKWRVKLAGPDFINDISHEDRLRPAYSIDMSAEAFFAIVRERL